MRVSRHVLRSLAVLSLAVSGVDARAQGVLDRPGPVEQSANPVTPENPVPARTLAVAPLYPPEAASVDATGRISLIVTVNELGRVAEVRRPPSPPLILSGRTSDPALLRAAADALVQVSADAVRQWQYAAPAKPPITFSVGIVFKPGADPELAAGGAAVPEPRPQPTPPPLASEPLPPEWGDVVRVGGAIRPPSKTVHVPPVYPPEARETKAQGVVILHALIDEQGRVADARIVRSIPLLDQAALDAVRQWQFAPTLRNGSPVPVVMTVTINFSLQ